MIPQLLLAVMEQADEGPVDVAEAEKAEVAGANESTPARMRTPAPKGASYSDAVTARLKACPDTNL